MEEQSNGSISLMQTHRLTKNYCVLYMLYLRAESKEQRSQSTVHSDIDYITRDILLFRTHCVRDCNNDERAGGRWRRERATRRKWRPGCPRTRAASRASRCSTSPALQCPPPVSAPVNSDQQQVIVQYVSIRTRMQ